MRGRQVTVTVTGEPVPMAADGELSELSGSRTWVVEAGAWQLLRG